MKGGRAMKKVFVLFLFFCFIVAGCATTEETVKKDLPTDQITAKQLQEQQVKDLIDKGEAEVRKKDFDAAIRSFEEALKLDPNNITAKTSLESVRKQKEQVLKSAEIAFKMASPKLSAKVISEEHINSGVALIKSGKIEEGLNLLQKAVEIYPASERGWLNIATFYHNQKKLDKAVEAYDACLKINQNNLECRRGLGVAYLGLNKLIEAKEQLEVILKINPVDKQAMLDLAMVYKVMANALAEKADQLIKQAGQIK